MSRAGLPLVVAALVVVGVLHESWDSDRGHARDERRLALAAVHESATRVEMLMLSLRFSILPSYDPLVEATDQLRERSSALRVGPEHIGHLTTLRRSVAAAIARVERLKRYQAAARNSERFLSGYLRKAESDPASGPIRGALSRFLIDPSPANADELGAMEKAFLDADNSVSRTAARHASVLRDARVELDRLTMGTLAADTSRAAAALVAADTHDDLAREREARLRRMVLLVLVLLAALALVVAPTWRRDSQHVDVSAT